MLKTSGTEHSGFAVPRCAVTTIEQVGLAVPLADSHGHYSAAVKAEVIVRKGRKALPRVDAAPQTEVTAVEKKAEPVIQVEKQTVKRKRESRGPACLGRA